MEVWNAECLLDNDIAIQNNLHDLQFDLPRSLKVKGNGAIGKPTYDFLLENNGKYMNILRDIAIQNMQDLEFDLSKSLKVEVNGAIRKCQSKMNDSSNMKSGTVWALGRFDDPAKLQKRLSDRFRENLLTEYDRRTRDNK